VLNFSKKHPGSSLNSAVSRYLESMCILYKPVGLLTKSNHEFRSYKVAIVRNGAYRYMTAFDEEDLHLVKRSDFHFNSLENGNDSLPFFNHLHTVQ
jgi:hypothetical protein